MKKKKQFRVNFPQKVKFSAIINEAIKLKLSLLLKSELNYRNPKRISSGLRWASSSTDKMASVSMASNGKKRLLRLFLEARTIYKRKYT